MINLLIFLLGISVGSFLNVLIDRIPQGKSFLKGRSHCDFCHKTLAWSDLVPIVSFLLLQGKCRNCHKKLFFQYPIIELTTGLLFVLTYNIFQSNGTLFLTSNLILVSGLIVLSVMDLKYGILADEIIFSLIVISVTILIYQYMIIPVVCHLTNLQIITTGTYPSTLCNFKSDGYISFAPIIIIQRLLVAVLTSAFFLILAVATKGKGMGGGDIKLAFVMGLILGFPNIIIALYMAFISGGAVACILLILKKKHFGQTIPFGPFLALATIITIFFGDKIWFWYSQKFLSG